MGEYRKRFLSNALSVARHREDALHAIDREIIPQSPVNMLLAGVENGGSVELWQSVLPEGSTVRAVDKNPDCARLPVTVDICDIENVNCLRRVLRGERFHIVVDSTGTATGALWPYLRAGGLYVFESVESSRAVALVSAVARGEDSWLPGEEVMRVSVYGSACVVEKRNPRVVPYLEVMTGNFADVVSEVELRGRGVRLAVGGG